MKTSVIIPTLNEENAIGNVIDDFKAMLPDADIYVIDGYSTDKTVEIALQHEARILLQSRAGGKGIAVREAFKNIPSDIYIIVDGDDTYDSDDIEALIEPIIDNEADVVLGARHYKDPGAMSLKHRFGNWVITKSLNLCFKTKFEDVLTGYRALNKKAVRELTLLEDGFAVETEMTIKHIANHHKIKEVKTHYYKREGTKAKLKSFEHGSLILSAIFLLFRDHKPIKFFGAIASILFIISTIFGYFVVADVVGLGSLGRPGLALVTVMLFLASIQLLSLGLVLDSINQKFKEIRYERSPY